MDIWSRPNTLAARSSMKWRNYPRDVLPMWIAEMDVELAEPVRKALERAVALSDTGYSHPNGLFEAFAGFAARRWEWQPDPARMALAPDVATAVMAAIRLLSEPGDGVVINTPVYPPFFDWIALTDRRLVASPLAAGPALDLDRLERDFQAGAAIYLLCNPHNPTGLVLTAEELTAVAALAERYHVTVLVDEIHAPLVHAGAVHRPFATIDAPAARNALTMVSASKAWNLPGLKCTVVVGGAAGRLPAEVQESAGLFGVLAAQAAYTDGDDWLDTVLAALDENRHRLGDLLAEHLPAAGYRMPAATYLAWLDLRPYGLGDNPAEALLDRGRVALSHGPDFGVEGNGHARLNFGTPPELLDEGVRRMAAAVSRR